MAAEQTTIQIEIEYNSETYNLENSNETKLVVKKTYTHYQTEPLSKKKPIIKFTYNNISIKSNNIHHIYVILQYIYDKNTLIELSKHEWDYSKWKVQITSNKKLPDWANILNCLLNLKEFNKALEIKKLEENVTLNDKRGWGGNAHAKYITNLDFLYILQNTKKFKK